MLTFYAAEIAVGLEKNLSLRTLDLSNNQVKNSVRFLSEALCHNSSLLSLTLSSNFLENSGAFLLVPMLKKNTTLRTLFLDRNGVTEVGYAALAVAWISNRSLQSLGLSSNPISDRELACDQPKVLGENQQLTRSNIAAFKKVAKWKR